MPLPRLWLQGSLDFCRYADKFNSKVLSDSALNRPSRPEKASCASAKLRRTQT